MKKIEKFLNQDDSFWSIVRLVSETIGYSSRQKKDSDSGIRIYTMDDIEKTYSKYQIDSKKDSEKHFKLALEYLNERGNILLNDIKPNLLNKDEAKEMYESIKKQFPDYDMKVIMNKQKAEKKYESYLSNTVNILTRSIVNDKFDGDPMKLGVFFDSEGIRKTLPRRMDGMITGLINPKVVWEVKEYYSTTTFGSRIADGVYETMLVGEELKRLKTESGLKFNPYHILFTDNYLTRWVQGKSYLCRFVDLVHMGLVDQVFFLKRSYKGTTELFIRNIIEKVKAYHESVLTP